MTGFVTTPTLQDVYEVLQPFIMTVTGLASTVVIQGTPNRAAMPPASPGYVSMQAVLSKRLRTNLEGDWLTLDDPVGIDAEQGTELEVQIDCFGASAPDWGAALSTLLRSDYGCAQLAGLDGQGNPVNPPLCQPLYVTEVPFAPLDDSEEQYEQRWIVRATLQYNPVTTTPMQFAEAASVTVINVDEAYPP